MKTSKSPRWKKVKVPGFVSLFHDGDAGFRIRYTEPGTGKNIRRTITEAVGGSMIKARELVEDYNLEIASKRHVPGMRVRLEAKRKAEQKCTLEQSLTEAIRAMGGNKDTRARALQGVNRFLDFMEANYPDVKEWSEIRPSMAVAWIASLAGEKLAWDTIRLALVPIKYASVYWHEETGAIDFMATKLVKGKLKTVKKAAPAPEKAAALTARQLMDLLAWLKANRPALYPMAMLQGLAGLRMFEAAYLRRCDVDLNGGFVRIDETPLHTPKNRPSYRTLPVHPAIVQAVREHDASAKVQSIASDGELFLHSASKHSNGRPWTHSGLFSAWRLALKEARPACKLPANFTARNLRATFVTLARRAKVDYPMLQQYIGHSPHDVLSGHYDVVSPADLKREIVDVFVAFLDGEMTIPRHGNVGKGVEKPAVSGDKLGGIRGF